MPSKHKSMPYSATGALHSLLLEQPSFSRHCNTELTHNPSSQRRGRLTGQAVSVTFRHTSMLHVPSSHLW